MHFLELHCQDTENLSSHSQLIQSLRTAVFQGKMNNNIEKAQANQQEHDAECCRNHQGILLIRLELAGVLVKRCKHLLRHVP